MYQVERHLILFDVGQPAVENSKSPKPGAVNLRQGLTKFCAFP